MPYSQLWERIGTNTRKYIESGFLLPAHSAELSPRKVTSKQLVGMFIIVIAKKETMNDISDVRTSAAGVGFMGLMVHLFFVLYGLISHWAREQGNKGGVAVRLTLYKSNVFTFVNSHLAAYDDFTEKRNSDFHELIKRLNFVPESNGNNSQERTSSGAERVYQTDALFWMVSVVSDDRQFMLFASLYSFPLGR